MEITLEGAEMASKVVQMDLMFLYSSLLVIPDDWGVVFSELLRFYVSIVLGILVVFCFSRD